ncbi:alpha-galactosidase [Paenibacillus silvisoli]|uniref:hypothetical protein n=1 Tax=Paenibacillus silvisoli TaxID=3110539 RepID=UPI0028060F74|nr:hypothetical protein [Paenibacillus silvisoli]
MTNELQQTVTHVGSGMKLEWDLYMDRAVVARIDNGTSSTQIWTGSLLPAFELDGHRYIKASATGLSFGPDGEWRIALDWGEYGTGLLICEAQPWGFRMAKLEASWSRDVRIVSMQFGTRPLTEDERRRAPRADSVFWSDWAAEGYCVPAAGSSPTHSFWRAWDMGDARLPLGSFGDAMGTPYAAAFPRPLYAAAMGGRHGWLAFGPGEVPDAPLSLQLQSATSSVHYAYREDLWGAPDLRKRTWTEPLRLAWGGTGYDALAALFDTFGPFEPKSPRHLRSFLCTWGDFKEKRFDLKQYAKRVSASTPADMVIMDDYWETFNGSGEPNLERFPDFEADLAGIRSHGYELAFWQSVGWTDQPAAQDLTADDLLCGPDGEPRQWSWSGNPFSGGGHYLLDPSSERTRRLIRERTARIVERWRPAALKLDFGYGFPGPDACAPRNPAYRGERLAYALLKLIYDAAKSVDPEITIIYYGIHPLMRNVSDLVNLDDLGDAGDSAAHEAAGHNQRCLWASLAARHGMAVNTSTGYYWDTLGEILLNTAVVGVNGLTLGETDNDGKRMTQADINRWAALQAWRRRACGWKPLWLEAELGSSKGEPKLVSWGRLESPSSEDAPSRLTALALRNNSPEPLQYADVAGSVTFTGSWALIAQDDADLAASASFVCIPFSAGELRLERAYSQVHAYAVVDGKLIRVRTVKADELPDGKLVVTSADELSSIAGYWIE